MSIKRATHGMILGASVVTLIGACTLIKNKTESDTLIVGGQEVNSQDPIFKSTVSLNGIDGMPICTGFLYKPRIVVTAAHCLLLIKPESIGFGRINSRDNPTTLSLNPVVMRIDKNKNILPHPQFKIDAIPVSWPDHPGADLGVIYLPQDAPSWAVPVDILADTKLEIGDHVFVTGYGRTNNNNEPAGYLRKLEVAIDKINEKGFEIVFAPLILGSSSCHGDSGGPMYVLKDNNLFPVGVTSRAVSPTDDCHNKAIYTDVRKYVSWINQAAEQLQNAASTNTSGGAPSSASSDPWHHFNAALDNNIRLAVDYLPVDLGVSLVIKDLWVNLCNDQYSGNDVVEASLKNYNNSLQQKVTFTFDSSKKCYTGEFTKYKETSFLKKNGDSYISVSFNGAPIGGNEIKFTLN